MIIRLILLLMLFYPAQTQNDDKKPPELDLRNFDGTINGLSIGDFNTLIEGKGIEDILLLDNQIDAIKLKAKNFIPTELTENDIIIIITNFGELKFSLYDEDSPLNCTNFKKLSNSGFYDNTLLHNVVPKFIIQGGDILTRNHNPEDDGQGGPGWTINAEFNNLKHTRGTLSMVRTANDPNSAGSQFFIALDSHSHLDNKYTVFGYIIEGNYVLDLISKITTEYDQAMMLTRKKIPDNADPDNWIEVYDHHAKQKLFSKVPEYISKQSYRNAINKKIKNIHKPGIPLIIKSIRVVNSRAG